jgi:ectoine hydroxylase
MQQQSSRTCLNMQGRMTMLNDNLSDLTNNGFCHLHSLFDSEFVARINRRLDNYIADGYEGIVFERDSAAVRGVHGMHLNDPQFLEVANDRTILDLCTRYLEDGVYIHQYKVNMKQALEGKSWPWHQDFVYWRELDHIPSPRLLNIAVALDDISMLQGPLCFIPKSHKLGDLSDYGKVGTHDWQKAVSADLTYQLDKFVVAQLLEENGFHFALAKAGDVIVFDPQLAHCSSNNLSGTDRRLMIITVNAVSNLPTKTSDRPAFLAAKEFVPLNG